MPDTESVPIPGIVTEIIVIFLGIQVNQASGFWMALAVFLAGTWLAYRLSSRDKIFKTLGMLIEPAKAALLLLAAAIIYFGLEGFTVPNIFPLVVGFALIGGALGIFLLKYWTIGD